MEETVQSRSEISTVRWFIASAMVIAGGFLWALSDRTNSLKGEDEGDAYLFGAVILTFGSAFVVRKIGKKLFLWIPFAYFGAIFLSLSFAGPATSVVNGSFGSGTSECQGAGEYVDLMYRQANDMNARTDLLKDPDSITPRQYEVIIAAQESDIANLQQQRVPSAFADLHSQLIVLYQGWLGVFEALRDNTYSTSMLFDLQKEDDEVERLTRQVNVTCGGQM